MGARKLEGVGDTDHFATALERARRERGLSQAALAQALGTSQSTISKLLSARHEPRPALRAAIVRFIREYGSQDQSGERELMSLVEATSQRSVAFRALLQAALNLVHKNE